MSINRTRWLDKRLRAPHQADGPIARWHLLRPLMQLLLTSAAPSNIGQGGDTIIQTQIVCRLTPGSSKSSQYHELNLSSLHRSNALFVQRLDLRVSSLNWGHTLFSRQLDLCVSSLCKPYLCIKKKNLTTLLRSYMSFLCRGHAGVSRRRKSVILVQGPAEDKASGLCRGRGHLFSLSGSTPARNSHLRTSIRGFHRLAPREHHGRPFWRETWR